MKRSAALAFALFLLPCSAMAEDTVSDADKAILEKVKITDAKLVADKNASLSNRLVLFTVKNESQYAIRFIDMAAQIKSPDRSVPWVEGGLNYSVPGGIEPGETKAFRLTPPMMGHWDDVPDQEVGKAVLTLTPRSVELANGHRIGIP